jgi:hypothetical protein
MDTQQLASVVKQWQPNPIPTGKEAVLPLPVNPPQQRIRPNPPDIYHRKPLDANEARTKTPPNKKPQEEAEQQKETNHWVLPVIVGAGLLTAGLLFVFANAERREKLLPFLKKEAKIIEEETLPESLNANGGPPPNTPPPNNGQELPLVETGDNLQTIPSSSTTPAQSGNNNASPLLNNSTAITVPAPLVAPTAGEKAREDLWNSVMQDINGQAYPAEHWSGEIGEMGFTTADLQHFQAQCLSLVKDQQFKKKLPKIIGNDTSVVNRIIQQLKNREQGTLRGLSSEENHLALAYAYYNKALILVAKGVKTKEEDFKVRQAFGDCVEHLTLLDYVTQGSDGYFFYEAAKDYLPKYIDTDAVRTSHELPKATAIDGLLSFPVFKSEVAFNALKQATVELNTVQANSAKFSKMEPLLTQAEEYYQAIVADPDMALRWHGHAGLAETFALKAKLAQVEESEEVARFKQQAQEQLTLAIEKSKKVDELRNRGQTLPYKMGNTLPKKQHDRIQGLL